MMLWEFFPHEITVNVGAFLAFLVAYCSFQDEEYIYHDSLFEKAPCFTKMYVNESWPVPAKQVGIL